MRLAATLVLAAAPALMLAAAPARAQQYPLLDRLAEKVVAHYQSSSCPQLAEERAHPPGGQRAEMEQRLVTLLHEDPAARQEFLGHVAVPIANKLFECGMIP